MTEPRMYTQDELDALSAEDVEKLAADRGVEPEQGSGKDGNVVKADRIAAILQAQAEGGNVQIQEGDGVEKTGIEATPDGTETTLEVGGADEAVAEVEAGDRVAIVRTDGRGWWCPICDYAHPHLVQACTGCKAVRDGDEVIAHAAG